VYLSELKYSTRLGRPHLHLSVDKDFRYNACQINSLSQLFEIKELINEEIFYQILNAFEAGLYYVKIDREKE